MFLKLRLDGHSYVLPQIEMTSFKKQFSYTMFTRSPRVNYLLRNLSGGSMLK